MPKGEIVGFPGGRDDSSHSDRNKELDKGFINLDHVTEMLFFLAKQSRLQPETNFQPNIQLRRDLLLKDASDQELINAVNDSSEVDWSTKPAYYRALIEELLARGIIPNLKS